MEELKKIKDEIKTYNMKDLKGDLKRSFMTAMKDEDFARLVNSLKFSEEELMKHTSKLEICAKEINNCQGCPSLLACKNEVNGFRYIPLENNERLDFTYEACKYKSDQMEKDDLLNHIAVFDIRREIREATFKDVYKDDKKRIPVLKQLTSFLEDYGKKDVKGIYLHGNFGSGKTYLIAALFNELAKKDINSAIVYFPEFLRSLKSFADDYNDRINFIKNIDVLLIDDIGAENVSSWTRDEILGTILQSRMEAKLPTFFTSNLNINELEDRLSVGNDKVNARRIVERIKYLTEDIELIGENRRK